MRLENDEIGTPAIWTHAPEAIELLAAQSLPIARAYLRLS